MTSATATPPARRRKPKTELALGELPADLLKDIEKQRGDTAAIEWDAQTIRERIDSERLDAEPVLDLDAEPQRPRIRFQKTQYELRNLTEFGPVDQHQLNRDGREFAKIWQSEEELSQAEQERLTMLIDTLFGEVLICPDDVREQFTPGQRAQVVLSFTVAPAREQLAQLMALIQQVTQPGNESA